MTLQRLVLDYRTDDLVVHCLYRRSLEASPNPGTKARAREDIMVANRKESVA